MASNNEQIYSGFSIDLLWTNPNPSSNFAAQSVEVDLSNYDKFMILTNWSTSNSLNFSAQIFEPTTEITQFLFVTSGGTASSSASRSGVRRFSYSITNHAISFQAGYYNSSSNNSYLIPVKIYGLKFS